MAISQKGQGVVILPIPALKRVVQIVGGRTRERRAGHGKRGIVRSDSAKASRTVIVATVMIQV